jgi:hypothetical protein
MQAVATRGVRSTACLQGGEIQETAKRVILARMEVLDKEIGEEKVNWR